jgi:hypothetical protein
LPVQYFSVFTWGSTHGNPEFIWDKGLVARQAGSEFEKSNKITLQLYEYILDNNYKDANKLFKQLNIRYIVQRNDFDWRYYSSISQSPETIKNLLSPYEKIKTFGELDIYKMSDAHFLPNIYPASNATVSEAGMNKMLEVVTSESFMVDQPVLLLSEQINPSQWQFIQEQSITRNSAYSPKITFQKINPTKYKVHVNASHPFFLVFSESYHPQWKAYTEDKGLEFSEIIASYTNVNVKEARHEMKFTPSDISYLFAKPLPEDKHFLVNGYANAWYIDPEEIDEDGDGSFVVTLYFLPQSLFYSGLFISGMTFISCFGFLFYDWRRVRDRGGLKRE